MPADAFKWLTKADRHRITAHLNADHQGFPDTTCYFAHQTVELALKAYLISHAIEFPKIHALPQLLSLCMKHDDSFSRFADDIAFVNGFYIEAKYPLDVTFDPSPEDTQRALNIADTMLEFIKQHLRP